MRSIIERYSINRRMLFNCLRIIRYSGLPDSLINSSWKRMPDFSSMSAGRVSMPPASRSLCSFFNRRSTSRSQLKLLSNRAAGSISERTR
ncbi:hypothetical protein D3C79_1008990 [compost metagenome]